MAHLRNAICSRYLELNLNAKCGFKLGDILMNTLIKRIISVSALSIVLTAGYSAIASADKCPSGAHKVNSIECAGGCQKGSQLCCKKDTQPAWCHRYKKSPSIGADFKRGGMS